jgi:hypothetical protein
LILQDGYLKRMINFLVALFKTSKFRDVSKQRDSPHLYGNSPHVASGKWVGQRWSISMVLNVISLEGNQNHYKML